MAVRSKQAISRMLGSELLLLLVFPLCWGADDHFRDITKSVFRNENGYLAAFADFNSDKSIDVFVLIASSSKSGFRQVDLNQLLTAGFSEEQFTRTTLLREVPFKIDAIIPADFNGDRVQDLLVYSKEMSKFTIYWGTGDYSNSSNLLDLKNSLTVENVHAEPLLFDFDGDRIVDILTTKNELRETRTVLQCAKNNQCVEKPLGAAAATAAATAGKTLSPMARIHSNSFVDVDGDSNPDVLVSTETHFELWIWKKTAVWEKTEHDRIYPRNLKADSVGQSVFVDFDSSGRLFHVVQSSSKDGNFIYAWVPKLAGSSDGDWVEIFSLETGSKFWKDSNYENGVDAVMSLKSADLDQNGYPDFMTIVELEHGKRGVLSLMNQPCTQGPKCSFLQRNFTASINPGDFGTYPSVTNLGFFDIRENGKMDALISVGDLGQANWTIAALENTYTEDACFIKVITVSGLCAKDQCRAKKNIIEYGYNQPGPVVSYRIVDSDGRERTSIGSQLYQTSHGSLQLPYILFGIGLSPNFVKSLTVRMPGLNKSHQWPQLIPNSQMLVIPNPKDDPSQWQNKLFITPSRKMLMTAITLFGVVLVNVIIILALHVMEKKADRIERQQQAHRFNFDAM